MRHGDGDSLLAVGAVATSEERLLDPLLSLGIERSRRLIENQHVWVHQQRPSQTDASPLATGQATRAVTSRVGYLAPDGMYVSLTQSNADEPRLIGSMDVEAVPTGAQDIDGTTWVVYEPGEGEPIWTTRLSGPVQVAITGAGSAGDFRTLAQAVQNAEPLPTA